MNTSSSFRFARTVEVKLQRFENNRPSDAHDIVAVEEPLAMYVQPDESAGTPDEPFVITMRTPGHDRELVAGFLLAEGIIDDPGQVADIYENERYPATSITGSAVTVTLGKGVPFDLAHIKRHVVSTSSCGICGRISVPAPSTAWPQPESGLSVDPSIITRLPDTLKAAQTLFKHTGGIHAAALFDLEGHLIEVREDVGRHNAMDKLMGAALISGILPLSQYMVLLSGRVSYELVQKAVMAGIPIIAAIGAPSSLAIDLAHAFHITLVGFIKPDRFNVYTGGGER